jgi:DNA repair photolyase
VRDLGLLKGLRVGFSVTTDREDVRRIFEPHCAPVEDRWRAIRTLRKAGVLVFATLAPILPCDPEALVARALEETDGAVIADPFHVREVKRSGATTRPAAVEICRRYGWEDWLNPGFQQSVLTRMRRAAESAARAFGSGPAGFSMLHSV